MKHVWYIVESSSILYSDEYEETEYALYLGYMDTAELTVTKLKHILQEQYPEWVI